MSIFFRDNTVEGKNTNYSCFPEESFIGFVNGNRGPRLTEIEGVEI